MKEKKLYRDRPIYVRVTEAEYEQIRTNMEVAGISKMTNYLRKMGLYGTVIKVDFSDFRNLLAGFGRLTYELNRIGNNINQIAKKVNESDEFELEDFENLKIEVERLRENQTQTEKEIIKALKKKIRKLEQD
ncbi:mobilisation protein (MobC) [Lactococcus garvieae]|uniref:Mobilisation protein (MobC) n=2 Tax=Lactococcus garvieae TaxID=1363 RepID=A0A1I4GJA8_9LACT|nr:mobilisation protein (MobC) [Lactococcus garvieae]